MGVGVYGGPRLWPTMRQYNTDHHHQSEGEGTQPSTNDGSGDMRDGPLGHRWCLVAAYTRKSDQWVGQEGGRCVNRGDVRGRRPPAGMGPAGDYGGCVGRRLPVAVALLTM